MIFSKLYTNQQIWAFNNTILYEIEFYICIKVKGLHRGPRIKSNLLHSLRNFLMKKNNEQYLTELHLKRIKFPYRVEISVKCKN